MTTPGDTIRDARIALSLSLRTLADDAGLTHVRLGEIERGAMRPATEAEEVAVLRAICRAVAATRPPVVPLLTESMAEALLPDWPGDLG